MSDAMAGRIFAGFLGNGHSVWWERKMPRTTEYIRADVHRAQIDAANKRIAELEAALRNVFESLSEHRDTLEASFAWSRYDDIAINDAVDVMPSLQPPVTGVTP